MVLVRLLSNQLFIRPSPWADLACTAAVGTESSDLGIHEAFYGLRDTRILRLCIVSQTLDSCSAFFVILGTFAKMTFYGESLLWSWGIVFYGFRILDYNFFYGFKSLKLRTFSVLLGYWNEKVFCSFRT